MLGLHPDLWLDGIHCLNNEWIIGFMISGASFTLLFYYIFSVLAFMMWRLKKTWLATNTLFLSLSIVFFLCGTIHFSHAFAKIVPEFYLATLSYIFLIPAMGKTLFDGYALYERVKALVPSERVQVLETQLERLERILNDNGINNYNNSSSAGKQCIDCFNNNNIK